MTSTPNDLWADRGSERRGDHPSRGSPGEQELPDVDDAAEPGLRGRSSEAIRPFTIDVSDEELADLRRRVKATRWPDRETDPSQGVQLATIQALASYWGSGYDWRTFEKRFAALPHFVTRIDGVDIHFIHVRSKHEDALPLIVTHGWPGSTVEQLKIIEPLTDPTAHGAERGGRLPSRDPVAAGPRLLRQAHRDRLGPDPHRARLGRAHAAPRLHEVRRPGRRLGECRHGAAGPAEAGRTARASTRTCRRRSRRTCRRRSPRGGPKPAGLSADEDRAFGILKHFFATGTGYAREMGNRPQTLYGIEDSPVGLAAWMIDHDEASYKLIARAFAGQAGRAHARRRPRQRHPLLADEVGDLVGPPLLGEPPGLLRRQGRRHPGRRDRLPRRALSGSAELGREGIPQAHPLQHGGRRRALRGLGAARAALRGAARNVPIAALRDRPMTQNPTAPTPSGVSGLLRSFAHRLADDDAVLPVEGHLASFDGATGWLNSEPLTPEGLRGRVVLVDFWTYTCVNWLRTLPYLRAWADEVRSAGPDHRRRPHAGVRVRARRRQHHRPGSRASRVEYPIAIDSEYGVWQAFANHFWPAVYLADARGAHPLPPLRRGRVRDDRDGHPAAADGRRRGRRRPGSRRRSTRRGSRWPPTGGRCSRPRRTSGTARAAASPPNETPTFDRPHAYSLPSLRLNQWALAGTWTVARHAGVLNEAERTDRVPLPRARREPRDGTGLARRGGPVPGVPRRPAGRRSAPGSTWTRAAAGRSTTSGPTS